MNWIKYAFHWENWNFEPIVYFAHITEFLNLGKARIIPTLWSLEFNTAQRTIFSFSKFSEKIVFPKKTALEYLS